jgi:hypothetical protein
MRCCVAGFVVASCRCVASSRRGQKTSRVARLLDASYACHSSHVCHLLQVRVTHLFPMSDL